MVLQRQNVCVRKERDNASSYLESQSNCESDKSENLFAKDETIVSKAIKK